ncbi:MAG: DUF4153 domain-containing protein [Saprospiraceae bacterium]|nr:DUF4153 domain-containing protein [Saprospiraceae bacterium]
MKLPSPGFLLNAFTQVCRRFPATMLAAFTGVIVLVLLLERGNSSNEDLLARIWMAAQLGLALLTGLLVFAEASDWSAGRKGLVQGIGVAALAAYGWYLFEQPNAAFENLHLPRYMILLVVAHLFVSVAPYLNRRTVADFWEYNRRLFANFVVGATFTMILFAGLALAILAVDQLFDLNLSERIYARLFILLAGIFNTSYFLYHFPEKYEFDSQDASYNAVFRNLCKYILIPIVGLYFLILYAYGAKIIGTWSLPRGWVGSLVIGFSVAGIFTYLLNFYLPQFDDSKLVNLYKKWFWWIVLPLTVLLFVAIGTRISDYGVTEPRFIVTQIGLWLAITCLYFLFSKSDNIKFIPISLGLIALSIAVGPLNAFSVAKRSQAGIVKNILEKNGRWENGRLKQGSAPMLQSEREQVISALQFLDRRGHLEHADWLPMPLDSFQHITTSYTNAGRIMDWLGLKGESVSETYTLNIQGYQNYGPTDIRGFTQYYPISLTGYREARAISGYYFERSADGRKIIWLQVKNQNTSAVDSFDLKPVMTSWRNQAPGNYLELTPETATLNLSGAKGSLRIRVADAQIEEVKGALQVNYLNGQLFLKER